MSVRSSASGCAVQQTMHTRGIAAPRAKGHTSANVRQVRGSFASMLAWLCCTPADQETECVQACSTRMCGMVTRPTREETADGGLAALHCASTSDAAPSAGRLRAHHRQASRQHIRKERPQLCSRSWGRQPRRCPPSRCCVEAGAALSSGQRPSSASPPPRRRGRGVRAYSAA